MRILVTGATGLIGTKLLRRLLEAGHDLVVLTRDAARSADIVPIRCELFEWEPSRGYIDPQVVEGVDAVVHLAGESIAGGRWDDRRKRAIFASRVDSTRLVLGLIADLPRERRPKVFVSASAIGYYGDRGDENLTEEASAGSGLLAEVCRAWENEIATAEGLGLRAVGLRTGIVLSRAGGALARMLPAYRLGLGGRIGGGKQWMSWIHLDDLVSLYEFALSNADVAGPLNAVAPAPVTNAEFSRSLARALRRPAFFAAPRFLVRLALGEMSELLLASQRVCADEALRLGFRFEHPDIDGALDDVCREFSVEYEREAWLPYPRDEIFAYLCDAAVTDPVTQAGLDLRPRAARDGVLREGEETDYHASWRWLPLRWRSRVEVFDPPNCFAITQIRGPFRTWRHSYELESLDDGTTVHDRISYELRGGALAGLCLGGLVAEEIEALFLARIRRAQRLFASMQPGAIDSGAGAS